jgi:hypothetical protein
MSICEISNNPPPEYDCGNVVALPSEENSVPITVIIQLDDFPTETSWSIVRRETDTLLVNVPEGTYTTAQATTQETVFLPPGSNNYFQIFDGHGNGLCCETPVSVRNEDFARLTYLSGIQMLMSSHIVCLIHRVIIGLYSEQMQMVRSC